VTSRLRYVRGFDWRMNHRREKGHSYTIDEWGNWDRQPMLIDRSKPGLDSNL
jgi:hypothetical protein